MQYEETPVCLVLVPFFKILYVGTDICWSCMQLCVRFWYCSCFGVSNLPIPRTFRLWRKLSLNYIPTMATALYAFYFLHPALILCEYGSTAREVPHPCNTFACINSDDLCAAFIHCTSTGGFVCFCYWYFRSTVCLVTIVSCQNPSWSVWKFVHLFSYKYVILS